MSQNTVIKCEFLKKIESICWPLFPTQPYYKLVWNDTVDAKIEHSFFVVVASTTIHFVPTPFIFFHVSPLNPSHHLSSCVGFSFQMKNASRVHIDSFVDYCSMCVSGESESMTYTHYYSIYRAFLNNEHPPATYYIHILYGYSV